MVWGEAWGSPQSGHEGTGTPDCSPRGPTCEGQACERASLPPTTRSDPSGTGSARHPAGKGVVLAAAPRFREQVGVNCNEGSSAANEPKGPGSWDLPQRARVARSRSCSIVVITSELDPLCDQTLAQSWFYRG